MNYQRYSNIFYVHGILTPSENSVLAKDFPCIAEM